MLLTKQHDDLSRNLGLTARMSNGYWTLFYLRFGEKIYLGQLVHAHASVHCASMTFIFIFTLASIFIFTFQ